MFQMKQNLSQCRANQKLLNAHAYAGYNYILIRLDGQYKQAGRGGHNFR
jgi:hypothetical protein